MRVRASSLAKTYPGQAAPALQPTALDVAPGEALVLLGPSGCGKTTLLRLIAGLESADAGGRILFDAEDVTALPVERRQIGMVFQSYALFPNMNVAENVGYGLKVRGFSAVERRGEVARLLETVGLFELAERRVERLSGGQRQRVALARALAIRPRVLLLDEPLAALDATLRERLRDEIASLLRRFRITAIYVTHDQDEAMAIGDRIAVMNRGRIEQLGAPEEIYRRPATAFVAGFVGTMNRVEGQVAGGQMPVGGGALAVAGPDRAATLWFRPESVRVGPAESAPLSGRVVGSTFFGASRRLLVDVGLPQPIRVDVGADRAAAMNDAVGLHVPEEALLELPSSPPPQA